MKKKQIIIKSEPEPCQHDSLVFTNDQQNHIYSMRCKDCDKALIVSFDELLVMRTPDLYRKIIEVFGSEFANRMHAGDALESINEVHRS